MSIRVMVRIALLSMIATFATPEPARAAISGATRVASGLSGPIFVTHAPGDTSRLFIVERGSGADPQNASAAIKILDLNSGMVLSTPFLTINGVDVEGEGGLRGLAFHPNYATNGKFYVNVTVDNGGQVFEGATSPFSAEIREYTVSGNPNVAINSPTPVLNIVHPQSNHNAGWIGFSPVNGYLYIPTGDGGGGNDTGSGHATNGNAQDIEGNLLGKVLRIDVNSDAFPGDPNKNYSNPSTNPYFGATTGDDEIWARGMRNPFRASFDRQNGDLWIGDVGQGAREEIDRQPFNAPGGENFGWRLREGNIQTPSVGGAIPANYRAPVYDYDRDSDLFGGSTVIGGHVYRGPDPSLQGYYFFADAASGNHWVLNSSTPFGTVVANINSVMPFNTGSHSYAVSFGEDALGNLYIAYLSSGEVYRIATNQLLAGDFDADGDVDNVDYSKWRAGIGAANPNPPSDGSGNAAFDTADYVAWRKNLGDTVQGSLLPGAAIPEPLTLALFSQMVAVAAISGLVRRRSRRIM